MDQERAIHMYIFAMPITPGLITHQCKASISYHHIAEFAKIFHIDEFGQIPQIQCSDKDYFDRLAYIGETFKRDLKASRGIIKYLETITPDQLFFIFFSDSSIEVSMIDQVEVIKELYVRNGEVFPYIPNEKLCSTYHISGNNQGTKKIYIGEPIKEKRICRFCGRMQPETDFMNKSHAISEFLGNKNIICYDECDECNNKFSETLERDLYGMVGLLYSLYGVKGKNGVRKTRGSNITIDNSGIRVKAPIEAPSEQELKNQGLRFEIEETTMTYVPQSVYKCFCKFAISIIDKKHLPRLRKTIEWISSNRTFRKLPYIWIKDCNSSNHPSLAIYIRKDEFDRSNVEFIIKLILLKAECIFTFPFIDDKKVYVNKEQISNITNLFLSDSDTELIAFLQHDFSSTETKILRVDFSVKGEGVRTIKKLDYRVL